MKAKEKFTRIWKYIIVANLVFSLVGIWMSYSQSLFLSEVLTSQYLAVAPQAVANTSPVVINPLTTQALLITALSGVSLIVSVLVIVSLVIIFKKD